MLWLKNKLAQLILWADYWGYGTVSPCMLCKSSCKKEKLCSFFESSPINPPTLIYTGKKVGKRVKDEWNGLEGKGFKIFITFYIIVGIVTIYLTFTK